MALVDNFYDQGYAMAGVWGQYFFMFDIENVGDFLGPTGQIHQFVMEEKMGGDVPVFELTFSTMNGEVIKGINEGSIIDCVFGRDLTSWTYSQMVIRKFEHYVDKADYWIVTLGGVLSYTTQYVGEDQQVAFPESTSKDAMIATAAPYFNISDETTSECMDEQTWLRMGSTPIKFINDTWKHSYMSEDNFLIYGIDFAGNFIVLDLKAMVAQPIAWILSHEMPAPPNMAAYNPDIQLGSNFGLMNHLSIYKKKGHYHDGNTEEDVVLETPELSPIFTSGAVNVIADQPTTWEMPRIFDPDNVHLNFNQSRYSNMTRSALTDSVELNIVIENKWQEYRLFDLVDFVPYRPLNPAQLAIDNEIVAGIYAITRISRFFGNNRCGIEVTISRDGINSSEGTDLLDWF